MGLEPGSIEYAKVADFLRCDLFGNVVMLKTMSLNPESAQVFYCEQSQGRGALVIRPTRDSIFDQRGYPDTEYIVLLQATHPDVVPHLVQFIPRDCNLLFKLTDPAVRLLLEPTWHLERATAYISYTRIGQSCETFDSDIEISDTVSDACVALFEAQGHDPGEVRDHFARHAGLCFAYCVAKSPVAACFTFRNFERVHEIGGVYTLPSGRRQGYAQKVVATAVHELQTRDHIPRYVVREDNAASMALAVHIGLKPLVTTEHWLYTHDRTNPFRGANNGV